MLYDNFWYSDPVCRQRKECELHVKSVLFAHNENCRYHVLKEPTSTPCVKFLNMLAFAMSL
jgi:hypothetical protein